MESLIILKYMLLGNIFKEFNTYYKIDKVKECEYERIRLLQSPNGRYWYYSENSVSWLIAAGERLTEEQKIQMSLINSGNPKNLEVLNG